VILAYSESCPVQAFRVGTRVYATQFHPELDLDGLATRIEVYKYAGYFEPEEGRRRDGRRSREWRDRSAEYSRGFRRALRA
jgi:GMP synthase (glutamine-hydrolysing)